MTDKPSNTEQMVMFPRELVKNYAELLEERCAYEASSRVYEILAKAADQHQGQPVAEVDRSYQGYLKWTLFGVLESASLPDGTKLYTSADPAEVYRLRDEIKHLREGWYKDESDNNRFWPEEIEALRAQLAERDALLRKMQGCQFDQVRVWSSEIDATLSASAEPSVPVVRIEDVTFIGERSTPVQRDERAEFERSIILERTNDGYSDVALTSILDRGSNGQYQSIRVAGAWEGWQSRAALERKL